MEPGALVQYYDEGWRYGYLVEYLTKKVKRGKVTERVRTGVVKVRPIAAFKQGTPRSVSVRVEDVKEPEIKEKL